MVQEDLWNNHTVEERNFMRDYFKSFHKINNDTMPKNILKPIDEKLQKWHTTGHWFPNVTTKTFVQRLLNRELKFIPGGERLIRLVRGRDSMSFIRFTSEHTLNENLNIVVAYSGYKNEGFSVVYFKYNFFVKE